MSIPSAHTEVPPRVRELADSAALTPVWRNSLGGLTFRTVDSRVIKWGPLDAETNMRDEAERMRWAGRFTLTALRAVGAVAAMSTEWNYGSGWTDALMEAYGVEPDHERLAYYRALWNAG